MDEIDTAAIRDQGFTFGDVAALCDEVDHLRAALGAALEDVAARTWERDHANASYHRIREELAGLRLAQYRSPGL